MLKQHQQKIIDTIKGNYLNPKDFKRHETKASFTLQYQETDLYFRFKRYIYRMSLFELFRFILQIYLPSFGRRKAGHVSTSFVYNFTIFPDYNRIYHEEPVSFDDALKAFSNWLEENVKSYILEQQFDKDPWLEAEGENYFTGVMNDNSPFTNEDKLVIKTSIKAFRNNIATSFSISEEKLQIIDEKLGQLLNDVENRSKGEWKMQAFSVITSIIVTLGFDHEQGLRLMRMFIEAFRILKPYLLSPATP